MRVGRHTSARFPMRLLSRFASRARSRPRSWRRGAFVVLLVLGLAALAPLAHAQPPDQTWIGGSYDGADLDEIVFAATSLDALSKIRSPVERPSVLATDPQSPVLMREHEACPHAAPPIPGPVLRLRHAPRSPPAA